MSALGNSPPQTTEERLSDRPNARERYLEGAIIRGKLDEKIIYLTFTGHEFAEGGETILRVLRNQKIKASFFLTGDFYRNRQHQSLVRKISRAGHYLGPHSDKHLLYAQWSDRNNLLVDQKTFREDLLGNEWEMKRLRIRPQRKLFLPPDEWHNRTIAAWASELGFTLINYTPGTISFADYTSPIEGEKYYSSSHIYNQILDYEKASPHGLNGFILLCHIGAGPMRTDKFFLYLDSLLTELKHRGYRLESLESLPD